MVSCWHGAVFLAHMLTTSCVKKALGHCSTFHQHDHGCIFPWKRLVVKRDVWTRDWLSQDCYQLVQRAVTTLKDA